MINVTSITKPWINSISIDIAVSIILDTSATFSVSLFNDGNPVGVVSVVMDEGNYDAWQGDDTYVKSFILTDLGLEEVIGDGYE